jgi:hypothetical protein
MPFFLDGNPTQSELSEAVNYLLGNSQQTTSTNIVNGQVTDALGSIVSYLYKYIYIKYADSFDGTVNFSNTPTNRLYYGLRNDDSATESTNPADYIWYQVAGGFSTNKFVFYSITGGRRINIIVGLSAPSVLYQADSGAAIDLDQISGSDGASSRICYAKSTSFALASTPATYQTSGPSGFPPANTWGGAETWQATPPTLNVNEALFQSDGIYNPVSNLTTWNVPYLSNLRVGALSAITANLGAITAGDLSIGSSPEISGITMTGTGSHLYSNGNFALGTNSKNFVFNGSDVYLNGFTNVTNTIFVSPIDITSSAQTIYSFSTTKASGTIFGAGISVEVDASSVVGAFYGDISFNITLRNTAGTLFGGVFTCLYRGAFYKNPVIIKINFPATFTSVVPSLPVGSYNIAVTSASLSITNSAGAYLANGASTVVLSAYPFVYQTLI